MQRRTDLAKPYGDRLESIGSISHLTDSNTGFRLPVASEHHRLRASGARTRGECSQAARKTHSCVGAFCRCSCCLWLDSGPRPSTSPPSFTTLPRSACLGSSSDRGPLIRPGVGFSGARSPSRVRQPSFATPAASRRSARSPAARLPQLRPCTAGVRAQAAPTAARGGPRRPRCDARDSCARPGGRPVSTHDQRRRPDEDRVPQVRPTPP